MKAVVKRMPFLLLFSFLLSSFGFSQNCTKSISYRILESRTFQIPDGTDLNTLNISDILLGKPEHRIKDVEICIDSLGFISISSTYSPDTVQHWRVFPIRKTVMDRSGIKTYDENNVVLFETTPSEMDTIPGITYAMNQQEMDDYGMVQDYSSMNVSDFANEPGVTSWSNGSKIYLVDSTFETTIDTQYNYMVRHTFYNNELNFSDLKSYKLTNGLVHPNIFLTREFLSMSNGGNAQVTETYIYLSYEIIDNGTTLISYLSNHSNHSALVSKGDKKVQMGFYTPMKRLAPTMSVFPNPAAANITVKLGGEIRNSGGVLTLFDSEGKTLKRLSIEPNSPEVDVPVTTLSSGIYYLKVENNAFSISDKFIKS